MYVYENFRYQLYVGGRNKSRLTAQNYKHFSVRLNMMSFQNLIFLDPDCNVHLYTAYIMCT